MNLTLEERGIGYRERTRYNAASADLTVAIAVDYDTAGERLTKSSAGDRYLPLPYPDEALQAARKLYHEMKLRGANSLNIAGNGLTHWKLKGIAQRELNQYVHDILALVHAYRPISSIRSGGQTGTDIAGLVAAVKIGIPATGTFPTGFLQRDRFGNDVFRNHDELMDEIRSMADALHPICRCKKLGCDGQHG
jgi:hypothetical protein